MIKETNKRTLVKALTWRLWATIALFFIGGLATGSWGMATAIIGIDFVVKITLYYIHERLWNKSNFGRELVVHDGIVLWFTGLSGSGKTTLADAVAAKLRKRLLPVKRLDGDVARGTFSKNLGFTKDDRDENNRRAAHVASYLSLEHIVLASFISPYQAQRDYARSLCDRFIEVHVDCPIEVCEARDPRELYAKVRMGIITSFTGIHQDAPYEEPKTPQLVIDTQNESVNESADKIIAYLEQTEAL